MRFEVVSAKHLQPSTFIPATNQGGPEMYYQPHMSTGQGPPPLTVTASYAHPQPTLLQPGPAQYAQPHYGSQYAYAVTPPPPGPQGMSSHMTAGPVLPLPGINAPAMSPSPYSATGFDTTGQVAPPGMKPRVTATLWEDEGSLCFQVEARGICVARREDNNMINGTKLLNVAGMTRGRRDGILKSEKLRHVVKIGPMHLKGVWIPYERALEFANKEKITEILYPLFVHNISSLLCHPTNQGRASQVMAAHAQRKQESMRPGHPPHGLPSLQHHHPPLALPGPQPSLSSHSHPMPSLQHHHPPLALPGPQPSLSSHSHPMGRSPLDRANEGVMNGGQSEAAPPPSAEEEADHEHDGEYTHDSGTYEANRNSYNYTLPPATSLPNHHSHLSPEMSGSAHPGGSGRATPRTAAAPQSYYAPQGYNTPPRVGQTSSNLYSGMGNERGPANGPSTNDVYANQGDMTGSMQNGYAPQPPMLNGNNGSMKRGRDDEDDRPPSGGTSMGLDLKRRKTMLDSGVSMPSPTFNAPGITTGQRRR